MTSTTSPFVEPFTIPARHLYGCPNIHLKPHVATLDVPPPTFMRAPGECPGTFALESAMDELADALKMGPVGLRLRNDPEVEPITGHTFSAWKFEEAYRLGAEKFGRSRRKAEPGTVKDGRYRVGYGVATAFYPVYQFPTTAKLILSADGSAVVQSGTHEMGMGTATVQAQHAADCLGLPVDRVRFEYGDTALPFAAVTGGSATRISVGAAVIAACGALKKTLLGLAAPGSPIRGAEVARVIFKDSGLARADDVVHDLGSESLAAEVVAEASDALAAGRTRFAGFDGVECLLEVVPPPPTLIVAGAGPDALPLVRLAKELGWLVDRIRRDRPPVVATEYGGTLGAPALFARPVFPALLALPDDRGAKSLILSAGDRAGGVPLPDGIVDVDTPADFERLLARPHVSPGRDI